MRRKVVLLGFDAGNKYLIRNWAESGVMPVFRSLLKKGFVGNTISLAGFFTGATWPSFATGVTPATNSVHSWEQLQPGTYDFYRCLAGDRIKREPFWNHLSRAGCKVAVLDVPLSGLTENLNGVQLVEWGAHDAQYGFVTWPPSLASEVEARFGRHPLRAICNADRDTAGYVGFRDDLLHGIRTKVALTKHFMRELDYDFFVQVFTESHCAGHQCWHIHDKSHPRHDAEQARTVGDPIQQVYSAIDAAIGEVLAEVDDSTTVMVLASHGMGYKYGPQFMLDRILLRLGAAAPVPLVASEPAVRLRDRIDPLLTWGWQHLPQQVRDSLQSSRGKVRHWIDGDGKSKPQLIDPAAGKCFLVENNYAHGGIRVNLAGREPDGKVAPHEFDRFCEELTRDLMDIVDADTGKRVAARVIKTRDAYRGEYLDHLPDLLVEWASDAPIASIRLHSEKLGELFGEYKFCRSGDHFPGGMFVAFGPGISSGQLDRTVSIMDFAPTVCEILNVPLPDVDGKPIVEIVQRVPEPA
jgi:predicted AlkP superfamily phosphohydrolase/phosphomutase